MRQDDYGVLRGSIQEAHLIERDAVSLRDFGVPYGELPDTARKTVQKLVPIRITLAEPE